MKKSKRNNLRKGLFLGGILILILILIIILLSLKNSEEGINSFQECVEAGYPILESFPKQCSDGINVWTEEFICEDMCGDGVCQEVVCFGEGCPCAETSTSCPQDC